MAQSDPDWRQSQSIEGEVPAWLWRGVTRALALALAGVLLAAAALAAGTADPPRAGPLLWAEDFKAEAEGWRWLPAPGGRLAPEGGALTAEFGLTAPRQMAFGLRPGAAGNFTLEVAGAAAGDAAYGLVFDWQDETHYSAVLINGHGYAEAYRQDGERREDWFAWQQWPHILAGGHGNRVRVDRRGLELTVRVNDEIVVTTQAPAAGGQVGVAARAAGPGRVVFSWARLWAKK